VLTLAIIDACWDNSLQHFTSDRSFSHECARHLGSWVYLSRIGNGRDVYCMFFSLNMRFYQIINTVAQLVYNGTLLSRNSIWISQVAVIMIAISVNNTFPIRGAAANSTFIAAGPPGFTALSILQLGSYGRKMCANTYFSCIFLI
jgi:hypothetical protein